MTNRRAALALCSLALLLPVRGQGQTPPSTDRRPLAVSPLALTLPLLPLARREDRPFTALHLHGSAASERGPGALSLGVEYASSTPLDSAGERSSVPLVMGAAFGYVPSSHAAGPHRWTAQLHAGGMATAARLGESLALRTGVDLALGVTDLTRDPTTSMALRFPVAMTRQVGARRAAAYLAPGLGWGRFGVRRCTDDGPGDNCGAAGVQVHSVRRQWLLAGGVDVDVLPERLRLTAGVQRMLARGEPARASVGVAWEP